MAPQREVVDPIEASEVTPLKNSDRVSEAEQTPAWKNSRIWALIIFVIVVVVLLGVSGTVAIMDPHQTSSVRGGTGGTTVTNSGTTSMGSASSVSSSSSSSTAGGDVIGSYNGIPFPIVDRAAYSDPANMIVNTSLIHPSLLYTPGKDALNTSNANNTNNVQPLLNVPMPTGAFWTNLVLIPPSLNGLSFPIITYPFAYKWNETYIEASYPAEFIATSSISLSEIFQPHLKLSTVETAVARHVTDFDPLSVTVRFTTAANGGGWWQQYMQHGSPYLTMEYNNTTPSLRAMYTFDTIQCPQASSLSWGSCNSNVSEEHTQKWNTEEVNE